MRTVSGIMYRCEGCGSEYPPEGPWRCACGHALDYADRPIPESGPSDSQNLDAEHERLARAGFHIEPTCATATVALAEFREKGALDHSGDVVALTGSGLKG